jgi:2,5-diketo-D-gluconate reductase A
MGVKQFGFGDYEQSTAKKRTRRERVLAESDTVPSVNQIEVHPYLTQEPLRSFNIEHSIVTEAWSPLASGKVIGDTAISAIADRIGKSVAQVTLRWHLQRGDIIFPKSATRSRIQENIEIFDFDLDKADMMAISALNRDERTGPHPDDVN